MSLQFSNTNPKTIYDQDFNLWREITIKQIKEQQLNQVDWEHLLEELEDIGKSQRRGIVSNLVILLAHLLKLTIQSDAPDTMKGSWYDSVVEHRDRIKQDLLDNPSLKSYLEQAVLEAYLRARKVAIKEGQLAKFGVRKPQESQYPVDCPFTLEQVLDDNFYGEEIY